MLTLRGDRHSCLSSWSTGLEACTYLPSTGNTGRVMKVRAPGSISRATALNRLSPTALQRTEPAKSEVSAAGNAWSMGQDVCPLGPRGILTASRSTPSRLNSQRTNSELDSRLWMATPVVIPPLLAAGRKEGGAEGRAGSHHGLADVGEVKPQHPADGTVRDHPHRSRHQRPSAVGRDRKFSQRLHLRPDRQPWDGLLFQCLDKAWKTQVRLRNRAIAPTSAERTDPTRSR